MALTKAPIESLYDVSVTLVPLGTGAPSEILLELTDKTLPGFEAAETWQISTDNPAQEIAKTIKGKLGNAVVLSFTAVYDPLLMQKLVSMIKRNFDVVYTYDNAALDEVVAITVHDCQLVTPASTSSAANAGSGQMEIQLQPLGGGLFADTIEIETAPRT